ncbi:hypothetical protein HPP92_005287 [Vanilla planifolia]|uniref:Bidirectional sugar transporter SWEET n=1 Tax=Vanilla planifolia TaxID=51239 RepID=A0A835V8Y1_VANPL|nr:hypothetical protein HPP92_005287 [Vanilla planifolia]
MISPNLARTVFGILGNAITLCLFLSPVPTFVRIYKNKSVEQFSQIPYIATFLNCMLWVLYGLPFVKPNSLLVLTINSAGVAIELCYIVVFITYSEGARRRMTVLLFLADVALVAIVAAVVLSLYHTHGKRTLVIGIISVFFCIMMYASPLVAMRTVIKTKSIEFMPFYLSMVSFFNGVCWTIYALLQFDINLLINQETVG